MCCGVCSTLRSSALLAHANTVCFAASSAASTRCLTLSATCRCPAACPMIWPPPWLRPNNQGRPRVAARRPPRGRALRAALPGTWRRWRSRPVRFVVPPRSRPGLAQVLRPEILILTHAAAGDRRRKTSGLQFAVGTSAGTRCEESLRHLVPAEASLCLLPQLERLKITPQSSAPGRPRQTTTP